MNAILQQAKLQTNVYQTKMKGNYHLLYVGGSFS